MAYKITTTIGEYTGTIPNRATDTPQEFADNVYNYQLWIDSATRDMNNLVPQINDATSATQSYLNTTENYKNETLTYRNDAQNSASISTSNRTRAEDAANRAEAVVIPEEATYSLADLENALNGLLTKQVAQQAQLNLLKQNRLETYVAEKLKEFGVQIKKEGEDLIKEQFSQKFYVDAINGDDDNTGELFKPFKTIDKAVECVPIGGDVEIVLLTSYTGTFNARLKNIYLHITSGKTLTIPDGYKNYIGGCSIAVFNEGHIVIEGGSNTNGDNSAGFFVTNYEKGNRALATPTSFYLINYKTSDPVTVEGGRYMFGSRDYGTNQNTMLNFTVYNAYCTGDITLDGKLFLLNNGSGNFQWNNLANDNLSVVDSDGNAIDITTTVDGIVRDADSGNPLNLLSNINFSS